LRYRDGQSEMRDGAATEDAIPCSGYEGANPMTMTLHLDTMTIAE